jgi:hypothetical protein
MYFNEDSSNYFELFSIDNALKLPLDENFFANGYPELWI